MKLNIEFNMWQPKLNLFWLVNEYRNCLSKKKRMNIEIIITDEGKGQDLIMHVSVGRWSATAGVELAIQLSGCVCAAPTTFHKSLHFLYVYLVFFFNIIASAIMLE